MQCAREQAAPRMLLISPVGLAYGWLPHGAALIKAYVEKRSTYRVDTLSLCVTFSEYIRENYVEFSAFDKQMGEWGSSFHEVYLATKYFQHRTPEQALAEVVQDMCEHRDIYQAAPWNSLHPIPDMVRQQQLDLLIAYCKLVEDYSIRALQHAFTDSPFLVGFSCTAQQIFSAITLAKYIKEQYPGISIVIGGPVITNRNAQSYIDMFPEIDATVLGDGEQMMLEIGNQLYTGKNFPTLPGLFTRTRQNSLQSLPSLAHSLDEIDAPDFDELHDIITNNHYPLTTWMARGCSWGKCKFCSIPQFQRSFLHRSASRIYQDLLHLSDRYETRRFRFGDWEVNGDRKTIEELCTLLIDGQQGFEFWGEINARKMTQTMMTMMKKAGFVSVQIGLEGLSETLLQKMKKPTTVLENIKCLIYAHECGLDLFSNLLYNFPGEEECEIAETLEVTKTIKHLIKPPVTLSLTEFLLETDADVIHDISLATYERFSFEKYCFPDNQTDNALFFLMKHTSPVHPGWQKVQQEIQQCYTNAFTFEHHFSDDAVTLIDDRWGERTVTTFTGLAANIYRVLAGNVMSYAKLSKYFPEQPMSIIDDWLQKFEAQKYLLRRGNHLLILSVNGVWENTSHEASLLTISPTTI